MRLNRIAIALAGALFVSAAAAQTPAPAATDASDWREKYAYAVGVQAVVYGYPMMRNMMQRYGMVERPQGIVNAPVNAWFHSPRPSNSDDKYGASPTDTLLYSIAWFDVSKEPVVVTVPDAGDRYYSIQFMEMNSDIFGYVGMRATGNRAGSYLLVGPGWHGRTPRGIAGLRRSPTPNGMLIIRILLDSKDNLAPAQALQHQTQLAPLSAWQSRRPFESTVRDVLDPVPPQSGDPFWFFRTINRGMTENPPPAEDAPLLATFANVGIGPDVGDDFTHLDSSTQAGLRRAITDGMALVRQAAVSGGAHPHIVNHWVYGQMNWGRTAQDHDFLTRASTQSHAGLQEHWIEEVVKLRAHHDGDGQLLDGANRYLLRFEAAQIPQARAFWAVTLYDNQYNLVANALNRSTLGSPDNPTMKFGADGSLEIYIQADPPTEDKRANWLPAPRSTFNLFMRTYLPGESLMRQTYVPPPVRRVGAS